jgi:hypothetical protein
MTTTTTTAPMTSSDDRVKDRSRRAADAAVDRAVGDRASPALRRAASEAVAPWAERLVRWLDDGLRIPGTRIGVGLDPILGLLLPGAGDAVTGTGSVALLFLALRERVPTVILLRMCLNILVDVLGGLVPFVGDAFDFVWRSNRRNMDLIERYREDPKAEPSWADYAVVTLGVLLAVLSIALPILIVWGLGFGVAAGVWDWASG